MVELLWSALLQSVNPSTPSLETGRESSTLNVGTGMGMGMSMSMGMSMGMGMGMGDDSSFDNDSSWHPWGYDQENNEGNEHIYQEVNDDSSIYEDDIGHQRKRPKQAALIKVPSNPSQIFENCDIGKARKILLQLMADENIRWNLYSVIKPGLRVIGWLCSIQVIYLKEKIDGPKIEVASWSKDKLGGDEIWESTYYRVLRYYVALIFYFNNFVSLVTLSRYQKKSEDVIRRSKKTGRQPGLLLW